MATLTVPPFTADAAQAAQERRDALNAIEAEMNRRYVNAEINAGELAVTMENARLAPTSALVTLAARLRLRNAGVRTVPAAGARRLTRRERRRGDQYGSGVKATAA